MTGKMGMRPIEYCTIFCDLFDGVGEYFGEFVFDDDGAECYRFDEDE